MIKKIIERLKAVKYIINADEYFIAVANSKNRFGQKDPNGPIIYEYMTNTDRSIFYTFVHDYIENNLRTISGKFICIRNYTDNLHGVIFLKGEEVYFENGYVGSYKIPNEEIFSHFKFISK